MAAGPGSAARAQPRFRLLAHVLVQGSRDRQRGRAVEPLVPAHQRALGERRLARHRDELPPARGGELPAVELIAARPAYPLEACSEARRSSDSASSSPTTSPYFASMSSSAASCGPAWRSATASRGTTTR